MGILGATTGLRINEVLGLKWEDIDFRLGQGKVLRSGVDGDEARALVGNCLTVPTAFSAIAVGHIHRFRASENPLGGRVFWPFGPIECACMNWRERYSRNAFRCEIDASGFGVSFPHCLKRAGQNVVVTELAPNSYG